MSEDEDKTLAQALIEEHGTDLTGAFLFGADLREVTYDSKTQWDPGFDLEAALAIKIG